MQQILLLLLLVLILKIDLLYLNKPQCHKPLHLYLPLKPVHGQARQNQYHKPSHLHQMPRLISLSSNPLTGVFHFLIRLLLSFLSPFLIVSILFLMQIYFSRHYPYIKSIHLKHPSLLYLYPFLAFPASSFQFYFSIV